MLRSWDKNPLLSRPLSVFDLDKEKISFVYAIHGQGTKKLSTLRSGEKVSLTGPLGNGWKTPNGPVALIGGGVGIAPLFLAAKRYRNTDVYLGFANQPFLVNVFRAVADVQVTSETGMGGHPGKIVDAVSPFEYSACYACGPVPLLVELRARCRRAQVPLYISLESRMACGIGACLGCVIQTNHGYRRVCRDGPVFLADEVIFDGRP